MEKGANVDIQDNNGRTALMGASFFGYLDVMKTLLEREVAIDIQSNNGATALLTASCTFNIDTVKVLLERGANVSIQDRYGKTFMDYVREKYKDEVQQIVDRLSGVYIKG